MTLGKFSFTAFLYLLMMLSSRVCLADNGSIAYAHPISNITIDGDLSDWPADSKTYEFQENGIEKADLHAVFRAGYHPESNSIYVAVEVIDDYFVIGEKGSEAWQNQDSHLLYIDTEHTQKGSAALLFGAWTNRAVYMEAVGSWDPKVAKGSDDMVKMAQKHTNGKTIYEWRIRTGAVIRPGTTIGIDHLLNDADIDKEGKQSSNSTLWGNLYAKSSRASRLGDLILVDPNQKTGTLRGSMRRHESVEGMETGRWRIRIQSVKNPKFWFQPRLDDSGHFEIELPEGPYILTTPHQIYGNNEHRLIDGLEVRAQVKAGQTSEARTLVLETQEPPDVFAGKELLFSYKPSDATNVDRFVKAYMSYYLVPGVSISLVRNGKQVYAKNFGVANAFTDEPVTNETLFEAGSVTKIAFAFAVHRLAERGVIDLDQPLFEILPFEDIAHDDRYRLITARHVLTHQTGFPNWARFTDDGKIDIKFKPGTGFRYSGEAFEWLGRVVAHVTGKSLDKVLEEETLKPMGFVKNTYFSDQGQLMGKTAFGHFALKPRIPMFPKQVGVAWSMHTNANALSPFMISLMARKGLSAKSYQGILTPKVDTPEDWSLNDLGWKTRFSLGFQTRETPFGRTYGHGGSNDGNECVFEIFDERDAGFIVMTNGESGRQFFSTFRRFLVSGE